MKLNVFIFLYSIDIDTQHVGFARARRARAETFGHIDKHNNIHNLISLTLSILYVNSVFLVMFWPLIFNAFLRMPNTVCYVKNKITTTITYIHVNSFTSLTILYAPNCYYFKIPLFINDPALGSSI